MDSRRKFTFCRLCLCKGEVLMDIFQEDERLYTAAEVIIDLLQFHVSEDDGYSKFVCLRCFNKLSDFKQFKEQCMESKDTFEKEFVPRFSPPQRECTSLGVVSGQTIETSVGATVKEEAMDVGERGTSQTEIGGSVDRENIVVEVDVYPQMPPSPTNRDTDTRGGNDGNSAAVLQARDLSLPRSDAQRLPNPYLNLNMVKKTKEKQRKAPLLTAHTSVGGMGENSVPLCKWSRTAVRGDAKVCPSRAVEGWQEMLSRTGVDIVSCDGEGQGRSESSVEYWRRKMEDDLDFGSAGTDLPVGAAAKVEVAKTEKACSRMAISTLDAAKMDRNGKAMEDLFVSDEENSARIPPPGGKIHRCDLCNKVFTRSSSLFRHKRIHTGEKPFICAECGKTFTQSGYLMQHMRVHSGDRRFACEECGKMFTDSGNLIQHRRVHTGEKPYGCNVCGMSFTQNGHLARHLKVHSGERPFQCVECGKKFTNCSNLGRHVKLHAEGRI